MIIFTTLKQKDLAAVSAQQLFDHYFEGNLYPKKINHFLQYELLGDFSEQAVLERLKSSYIFANPNKHHLITTPDFFNPNDYYVNVSRKHPLNLSSKVNALCKLLNHDQVTHVYESELWSFQLDTSLPKEELLHQFIESSNHNLAPFSHPLIHNISQLSFDNLSEMLPLSKQLHN